MKTLLALLVSLGLMSPAKILSPMPADNMAPWPQIVTKPNSSFLQISSQNTPQVLGAQQNQAPSPSPTIKPSPTPFPTPTSMPARKNHFSIALLGDSMIDTLGPGFTELVNRLKFFYPQTKFTIYNHGVGSSNINDGLTRLIKDYTYLDEKRPSLLSQKPDIVVVESFGYNPYTFDEGALDTHWLALNYIVDSIKQELPKSSVIIFATIAPNSKVFADGVPALNLSVTDKQIKTDTIKKYLENAVKYAKSEKLPLADAYTASKNSENDGNSAYISPKDHIHYSSKGKEFVASVIAQTIVSNHLLE